MSEEEIEEDKVIQCDGKKVCGKRAERKSEN